MNSSELVYLHFFMSLPTCKVNKHAKVYTTNWHFQCNSFQYTNDTSYHCQVDFLNQNKELHLCADKYFHCSVLNKLRNASKDAVTIIPVPFRLWIQISMQIDIGSLLMYPHCYLSHYFTQFYLTIKTWY